MTKKLSDISFHNWYFTKQIRNQDIVLSHEVTNICSKHMRGGGYWYETGGGVKLAWRKISENTAEKIVVTHNYVDKIL